MENRIQLMHPAGKKAVSMDNEKYDVLKKYILKCLKEKKEVTHKELYEHIASGFKKDKIKFEGSVEWNMEWVKLDMEAKKELIRTKDATPVRLTLPEKYHT